jgi:Big-like domain-containing protein
MKYETWLDFKKLDFTKGGRCTNDEARSLILYDVSAGRVLRLFDSPDGWRGDDSVEIIAKRHIARKMIATFERSFEDADVSVIYHRDNGLDGKVSRLEVDCIGGCNHSPTIIPPPSVLALLWTQRLTFTVRASDFDADHVEVLASGLPRGATLSPTDGFGAVTATLTWQPGSWDIGEHTIAFVARDGRGATSPAKAITIRVTGNAGSNQSPAISAPSFLRFLSDLQGTLTFTVLAVDRDGDQVEILASGLPAGATLSPTIGTGSVRATFTWRPGLAAIGTHRITFTANNGHGAKSAPAVTTINVINKVTRPLPDGCEMRRFEIECQVLQ